MKIEKNIAVSIIVPVYNMEKYLRRFMSSVICQTLPNIEIILVNKASTDYSLDICREYEQKYVDKVKVYNIPYSDTPAAGRNFGATVAKGEYFYFCDADDMVAAQAMEWLYTKAKKENADMVCGYGEAVFEDGTSRYIGKMNQNESDKSKYIISFLAFWTRIIKRELIEEVGRIPENTIFDDFCYIPFIIEKANKCEYIDKLVYYYFRRDSSTVGKINNRTMKDNIWSMNHLIEDKENIYRPENLAYIAGRIHADLSSRYVYGDLLLGYLKQIWTDISENEYTKNNNSLYQSLERYTKLSNKFIPKTVYVNGFGVSNASKFEEGIPPFYDEYEIVVLNESNCDIKDNSAVRTAYSNNNYEFVAKYFALKAIFEQGGFYVGNSVIIDNPINYLRIYSAVFSFMNQTNFTDEIFGAIAKNEVIKDILETYEVDFYDDVEYPLAKRMKNILNVKYGVKLNGYASFFQYPFGVLSPEMTIYMTERAEKHFTHIDASQLPKKEAVVIPKEVLDYIFSHTPMEYARLESNYKRLQREVNKYQRENKVLLKEKAKYVTREKENIE